jgi:(p)ppGpp synthase/HD superfamily hydrolase
MAGIDKAVQLACAGHAGVRDKGGTPYIFHALEVMMGVRAGGGTEDECCGAVMHDLVEDTDLTLDDLRRERFSEAVVNMVDAVSKRPDEDIEQYKRRIAVNASAKKIKIVDLKRNMDVTRLKNRHCLTEKDLHRIKVYAELYDFFVGGTVGV